MVQVLLAKEYYSSTVQIKQQMKCHLVVLLKRQERKKKRDLCGSKILTAGSTNKSIQGTCSIKIHLLESTTVLTLY